MLAIKSTLRAELGQNVLFGFLWEYGKIQIEIQDVNFPNGKTDLVSAISRGKGKAGENLFPFSIRMKWAVTLSNPASEILPRMLCTLYRWKENNTVLMSSYAGLNLLAPRDGWEFCLKSARRVRAQICRCKIAFATTDHKGANVTFWSFALPSARLQAESWALRGAPGKAVNLIV